ncbi:putative transcription factor/ chromatin remodeling BED-type(Zn) family [Helianthus annuus]|nr:putative transcription factor/ chromatin remodeling BED-type(Zn) family [Helianthus annuus]
MDHTENVSNDETAENETIDETQTGNIRMTTRKRKLKGECWKHFDEFYDEEGNRKGKCKYCEKELFGKNGTSSMNKHYKSCEKNPANQGRDQPNLVFNKTNNGQGTLRTWKFDPIKVRKLLVKMIIIDELPFSFVERPGFREFMEALCPNFNVPSRFTVARDILDLYLEEKRKLRNFFVKNNQWI